MGCGGGQNTTTTTTQTVPPQVLTAYQNLLNQGQAVASLPLQQYQGPTIAGFNPTQQAAFNTVNQAQGLALPYINAGAQFAAQGAAPVLPNVQQFSAANVNQYQSPFTQDVTQATQQLFNEQNQQQQQGVIGNAVSQGAWGGDRSAIAQTQLAQQQALAENPQLAQIQQQGYNTALQELNTQQQLQLQGGEGGAWLAENAGNELAAFGEQAQAGQLAGASAQLQTGALGQQLEQQELNVPIAQFQQQQAYPFQVTNFLQGLVEGIGPAFGGTSATTAPGPNLFGQAAGLGVAGLGVANQLGAFNNSAVPAEEVGPSAAGVSEAGGTAMQLFGEPSAAHGGRVYGKDFLTPLPPKRAPGGLVPNLMSPMHGVVPSRGFPRLAPTTGLPGAMHAGVQPDVLPRAFGGLVPPLTLGDMNDIGAAVAMSGASPVPALGPSPAHGLPFSSPQSTSTGSGGDSTGQTLQTIGTIASIAAMFSDPALKHVKGKTVRALDTIRALDVKDARYKWDAPGTERPMMMADNVERVAPHAAVGEAPLRGVDMASIVPMLVRGIQELDKRTSRRTDGLVPSFDGGGGIPGLAYQPPDTGNAALSGGISMNDPLIQIGAGMMASRSPFFLSQVGEGLQAGARSAQEQQRLNLEAKQANAPHIDNSGSTLRLVYPDGRILDTGLATGQGAGKGYWAPQAAIVQNGKPVIDPATGQPMYQWIDRTTGNTKTMPYGLAAQATPQASRRGGSIAAQQPALDPLGLR